MFVWPQISLVVIKALTRAETLPPLLYKILNYKCAHGSQSGLRMEKKWMSDRKGGKSRLGD